MKRHLLLTNMLFNQPLLATPELLDLGVRWANQSLQLNIINIGAAAPAVATPRADYGDDDEGGPPMRSGDSRERTGVAVVPVHGILVSRNAHMDMCERMTSYEQLRRDISAAVDDPAVKRIVLDVDSNGGHAVGAFEVAADIREMSKAKPITAIVNHNAYSAAYLIASACTEVVLSRTSGTGSIGVIASHYDTSKREEQMGIKVTTVFAGAHKNDLTSHEPLSEQSLQTLQDLVNESYQLFTQDVATYRGMSVQAVIDTQAGLYRGQRAIDAGLADRMGTAQQALDGLVRDVAATRRNSSSLALRAKAAAVQATL